MYKNIAGQTVTIFVIDITTNLPKTGDAANLTLYVMKDGGSVNALADTSATENDATNAPGLYTFNLTQSETNGDKLVFSGQSTTANIEIVPQVVYTVERSSEAGSGALPVTITIRTVDSAPVANAEVWITTDAVGLNTIAGTLLTNSSGVVNFLLDTGSYYMWAQKPGYNATMPQTIEVE